MGAGWSTEDADNLFVVLVVYLAIGVPLNFYFYHDVIDNRWRPVGELSGYCFLYSTIAAVSLGLLIAYAALQFDAGDFKEGGAALLTCFVALYGLYLAARQVSILMFYRNHLRPKTDSIIAAYAGEDGRGTPVGKLLFPDWKYHKGPVYGRLASMFLDDNYPGEGPRITWLVPNPEVKDWTELFVRAGLWIRMAVLPAVLSLDSALRPSSPPSFGSKKAEPGALWTVAALKLQFLNACDKSTERSNEPILLKTFIECVECKDRVIWQGTERSAWHVWKSILGVAPASEWSEAIAELPSKWNEGISEESGDLAWEVFLALALHFDESDLSTAQDVEEACRAPQGAASALSKQQPPWPSPPPSTDGAFKAYVEKRVREALVGSKGHIETAVLMGGFPMGDGERDSLEWMRRVKEIGRQTHLLAKRMDVPDDPSTSSEELTVGVDLVIALALLLGAEVEPLEFSSGRRWAGVGEVLRARRTHVLQGLENSAEALLRKSLERRVRLQNPLHSDVAQSRFCLGKFLHGQGKHHEAETLHSRAIQIWEMNGERAKVAGGLNAKAKSLRARGKFKEAMVLYDESLAIRRDELGGDHPDVAAVLSNKGDAFMGQAKYADAERCYQQAIGICRATSDGAQVLANNLAKLYMKQGRYASAKVLYQESLSADTTRHGENHPDVARDLRSLATVLEATGEYDAAKERYERAIGILEGTLGHEDVAVAAGLIDLAGLFKTMGRLEEAEPLYRRATHIDEKALGEVHRDVARDFSKWAELLQAQAKYAEAAPLYERAVLIGEKTLGASHPDVAAWLNKQGEAMLEMGQFYEARNVLQRSLRITDDLGEDDPVAAKTLRILGRLCSEEGKYEEAERLVKRALAIDEKTMGPNHPAVATDLDSLAGLLQAQGKYFEARNMLQRSLRITVDLGEDNPAAAETLQMLGHLCSEEGKHEAAKGWFTRSLAIDEKALGPDHPAVATDLDNLAGLLQVQGNYEEAERLYKRSLALREKVLGPDHPAVALGLNNLAGLSETQGNYGQAEGLFKRSLAIREKALGPDHPAVVTSSNNLVGLLKAQEKIADA